MSTVSRSKAAFWGTVSAQIFTIISMLVSIVSTPLMVRYLNKEEYGLSILFIQIVNYLALFDFGFSTAVIRNMSLYRGDDEDAKSMMNKIVSTGFFVAAFFGIIVTIFGFFFAPFVPNIFELTPDLAKPAVPIVFTLSLLTGVQFVQRGLGGIFFAHHRQVLISTPQFIINTISVFITVGLLIYGVGLWAFVYSNLFQLVGIILVQIVLLRKYYPYIKIRFSHYDSVLMRSMFEYGFFLFLNSIATQIILLTDRLVIGKIISLAAVSVFSITVRIPEIGMSLLFKLPENSLPAITEIANKEEPDRVKVYFRRLLLLTSVFAGAAFWALLVMDEWFIHLWVGPSFFAGTGVLFFSLLIMVQQTIIRMGSFFLSAKGVARALSIGSIVEAILNISLSVFLGKKMGLTGVLLGTLLASLLTSIWYIPLLLRRHLQLRIRDYFVQSFLWPLLGTSLVGGALYAIVYWVRLHFVDNWLLFFSAGIMTAGSLLSFTWLVYLREPLKEYVPAKLRPYLRVG